MTFEFQETVCVPDPDNTPFAALGVCADNGKILSVDYLPHGLRATKIPALDEQTKKVVGELAELLDAFLKDPRSVNFREVPLCYSAMREEHCKIPLDAEYRRKVFETLKTSRTTRCGRIRFYDRVNDDIGWSDEEIVEIGKAVDKAAFCEEIISPLAKAIGDICPANPFGIVVPCFRVVLSGLSGPRLGELGGNPYLKAKFGEKGSWAVARKIKRWLIEREKEWEVVGVKDGDIPPKCAKLRRVPSRKD